MFRIAPLIAALLTAPAMAQELNLPEHETTHLINLRLVLVPTPNHVRIRCALRHPDPEIVQLWDGCALTEPSGQCFVVALTPRAWYDIPRLSVIGHEIMHCLGYHHDE
jgi:hypothetical protein